MSSDKRENIWLNIGFNIAAPSILLIKGRKIFEWFVSDAAQIHNLDVWIFAAALAFPLVYGVYDLASRRKWNIFSIIGLLSVVLTGGIGMLKFSREWMIVKEGAVPLVLGAVVLVTAATRKPLAKIILMNESVVNVGKIDAALAERGTSTAFDAALKKATYLVAASFILSSALNFGLAAWIYQSEPGTEAFNAEVGKMTALSFPVIVLPTMAILVYAMYKLFGAITECTGLSVEDAMAERPKK